MRVCITVILHATGVHYCIVTLLRTVLIRPHIYIQLCSFVQEPIHIETAAKGVGGWKATLSTANSVITSTGEWLEKTQQ